MTRNTKSAHQSGLQGVARQTALYGVGMMFGKALSVLMLPVYTRFLTPADYGVMELIYMTLDVLMIIAGAQLVGGVYRFYHKAIDAHERNAVVFTAFLLITITFAAVGVVAVIAAPILSETVFGSARHTLSIRMAAATVVLTPTILVPQAYFRVRDRAGLFVTSSLAKLVLAALLNVFLLLRGWGVLAMFVSAMIATLLVGGSLTIQMLREVGFRMSGKACHDLVRYGAPLVLMNVATFAFTFGDRFFLQAAGGESAVGLYMMAYQFGFLLIVVGAGPFAQVWQPRRFEIASRPDRDELYSNGFVYANIMLLCTAAGIVLFIDDFFRVMTTPAFYPAAQYVPLLVLAYVFQAWVGIQDIGILVKERTHLIALSNWIAAGVALAAYALLIPRYSAWGAAWATFITMFVRYALVYALSQRLWFIKYDWNPIWKLSALTITVYLVGWLLPGMSLWLSMLLRGGVYVLFLAAIWHAGVLSESDRSALLVRAEAVRLKLISGSKRAIAVRQGGNV